MLNITTKYFSFFNNKPPVGWVGHITRDFLTCYSCSIIVPWTDKMIAFKNNAPNRSCISKTNNTFTDNAEDLDIFMSMYNFSEYSDNYSMTWRNLQNYFKVEMNDDTNENNADNYSTDNSKTALSQVNLLNM